MDNNIDIRLIYEWNARRAKLDFAIQEVEHQLASVNKRLKSLQHDLIVYIALLTVPCILYLVLGKMIDLIDDSTMLLPLISSMLLTAVQLVMKCAYIIMLPMNICHLIKTIMLIKQNKESNLSESTPPPLLGSLGYDLPPAEPSYRSEYNKLTYILTRYYLNQDIMDNLLKQIKSDTNTMTLADLKYEMNKLPFYEDVRPASSFPNSLEKKARALGTLITMCVAIIVLLKILLFG